MDAIIAEVRDANPRVDLRLYPRLVETRGRPHWQIDMAWRLTHTAFVDPEAGSAADSIRNFLERVIARELDLTSREGRAELRRFRAERGAAPAVREVNPAISLWERLDQELDDEDS